MPREVHWTLPDDIHAELDRRWRSGGILAGILKGEGVFPLRWPVRGPSPAELGPSFAEARRWVAELAEGSRAGRGFGYELETAEVENRTVGRQRLPRYVVIPTEDDGLRLLRRGRDVARAREIYEAASSEFPEVRDWLLAHPLRLVTDAPIWNGILAVLRWFRAHPRPGLYLRQFDIPGVDTKFVEAHRGLLATLLDLILPPSAIDPAARGVADFQHRYGLKEESPSVRFRVLDPSLSIAGLSDITVPMGEFAGLKLAATTAFVTENKTNGLAFPAVPGGVVIFGLGYGLEALAGATWLHRMRLWYWGDIDTHGFAMLSKCRGLVPGARSFLMDRATLMASRDLWVREEDPHSGPLPRLTDEESALFADLSGDRLGERVRLEQERIPFHQVEAAVALALGP